ncbi:hypothetical protein LVD15_20180 [Fulvivirga maritima]|uniref:hypothetical protein n=1 Tax=Fulvivirga maritima TaxID=2904247 RepID=UPI001F43C0A2|nr:hypothetical protein [Fulvivirga maritima]UII25602.1 hypothetical protein LVD15_20180 [Fulvivirga maritima]
MKTSIKLALVIFFAGIASFGYAQVNRDLQFYRPAGQEGLNVFETGKQDTVPYTGLKVRVGGDFAMQFQALDQSNDADNLVDLGTNLNLPNANLNIDVQLYDGVRMHLRTYLSARHHEESWVKGGHIQMDKLDFIKPGFLEGVMKYATIRIGLDEVNYGDAHFRRSDNARAIYNPFVGNYIMDAFTTEAYAEVRGQYNGFLAVVGITNGKLNQNVVVNDSTDNKLSFFGKLGYDKQLNDDLRVRLTGSLYTNQGKSNGAFLYGGDRGGARYYSVMHTVADGGSDFDGRLNPIQNRENAQLTAVQINPFVKYRGVEFFGIYEHTSDGVADGGFTQLAAELIYRFGGQDQLYIGGRYNTVSGEFYDGAPTAKVNRFNIGGGWYLTDNIMAKVEYVNQQYDDNGWDGSKYQGAEFDGFNVEAVIGF